MLNNVLQDFVSQVLDKAFQNYLNSILNFKENLVESLISIHCQAQPQPQLQLSWAEIVLISSMYYKILFHK